MKKKDQHTFGFHAFVGVSALIVVWFIVLSSAYFPSLTSSISNFKIFSLEKEARAAAPTSSLAGYAWSENTGWLSFNCSDAGTCGTSNYAVTLDNVTGDLSGYAWSEHLGWISFNASDTSSCPAGPCQANLSGGTLTGWAKAISTVPFEWMSSYSGPIAGVTLNGADGLFISGNYEYVATNGNDSLAIYDYTGASPVFKGDTQGGVPHTTLAGASSVYVSGNYAYVTAQRNDSLVVVNVSNPTAPTVVGQTQGPTPGTSLDGATSVAVSGNYAYVANYNRDSLAVINISNPASPTFVAETRGPTPGTSLDGANKVIINGNYAYIANFNRDSLAVIDISNPASPTFVAETRGPTPGTSLDGATDLAISGNYAYVTNYNRDSLAVINISNPASPTFVAETRGPTPGTSLDQAGALAISGTNAFVMTSQTMTKVDISDPLNPTFTASTYGACSGCLANIPDFAIQGNYAYLVTNLILDTIDISDVEAGGWDGFISLNCSNTASCGTSNYAVTLTGSSFAGYAWGSDVIGWLSFNCSNTGTCGTSNYAVTTSATTPPSITSFTATPSQVNSGSAATLNWTTANASSCTGSGGWSGSKGTSGPASTGSLTVDTSFTLICTNAVGSAQATVPVTIYVPPDFSISSTNNIKKTSIQVDSSTTTIKVTPMNSFTNSVALSASPASLGGVYVTYVFSSSSLNSGQFSTGSTLNVTSTTTIPTGQYTVTITGTDGSLVRTTNVLLNVSSTTRRIEEI